MTTTWREDLNAFRRLDDRAQFDAKILKVKQLYAMRGSIAATAKELGIGKRTLERAMREVPELAAAIEEVRREAGW